MYLFCRNNKNDIIIDVDESSEDDESEKEEKDVEESEEENEDGIVEEDEEDDGKMSNASESDDDDSAASNEDANRSGVKVGQDNQSWTLIILALMNDCNKKHFIDYRPRGEEGKVVRFYLTNPEEKKEVKKLIQRNARRATWRLYHDVPKESRFASGFRPESDEEYASDDESTESNQYKKTVAKTNDESEDESDDELESEDIDEISDDAPELLKGRLRELADSSDEDRPRAKNKRRVINGSDDEGSIDYALKKKSNKHKREKDAAKRKKQGKKKKKNDSGCRKNEANNGGKNDSDDDDSSDDSGDDKYLGNSGTGKGKGGRKSGKSEGGTKGKANFTEKAYKSKKAARSNKGGGGKQRATEVDSRNDSDSEDSTDSVLAALTNQAASAHRKVVEVFCSTPFVNLATGQSYVICILSSSARAFFFKCELMSSLCKHKFFKKMIGNVNKPPPEWIASFSDKKFRVSPHSTESLYSRSNKGSANDVTTFIVDFPTDSDRAVLQETLQCITEDYLGNITQRSNVGQYVLAHLKGKIPPGGSLQTGLYGWIVKTLGENDTDKAEKKCTEIVNAHFKDGFVFTHDVPLDKFLVDYDIRHFLAESIGCSSWDDLNDEMKKACYRDYPRRPLPIWDDIAQEPLA